MDSTALALLESNNELLKGIYINQLFVIGTVGALLVIYILYRFIKNCF